MALEPAVAGSRDNCPRSDSLFWRSRRQLDGHPLRLALTGGETAYGVLSALGWRILRPYAEPEPGACWSTVDGRAEQVFTKSGAFGSAGLLAALA